MRVSPLAVFLVLDKIYLHHKSDVNFQCYIDTIFRLKKLLLFLVLWKFSWRVDNLGELWYEQEYKMSVITWGKLSKFRSSRPSVLEIRMFPPSGYEEGTSHMRALWPDSGERVQGGQRELLHLLFPQTLSALKYSVLG